ncbi:AbrB family transcriptional regulator [Gloeobacter morelensis]|uniref:AbrB family transcriptional regulator n=1 Tax=Gloeobacter morelensis MG652769 TaxID=2781736 RepID=A0ABY3PPG9_9CYAN|nr:AbrB family transcriptional regulator [Gloeobacter morelensis]UFP95515.1 AbrB family transcriptional regulator [Gloeobacter morelensis MG652769]
MPLQGKNLLKLIQENPGKSARQLAEMAGYATVTRTGQKRVNMSAFQSAVFEAKGGREAHYPIEVRQRGELIDGQKDVALLSTQRLKTLISISVAPEQDERLQRLLEMSRDGALEPAEQAELERLMALFEKNILRQSQAGAELARRKGFRAAKA